MAENLFCPMLWILAFSPKIKAGGPWR